MTHLSATTIERLRAERERLVTVELPAARGQVEDAKTNGDEADGVERIAARELEARLLSRVEHIDAVLGAAARSADVVADAAFVSPGVVVSVDFGDGDVEDYLVGSIEEAFDGLAVLTPSSPMGVALLGASAGDVVSYAAPGGTVSVTVAAIRLA